jgi:integrase
VSISKLPNGRWRAQVYNPETKTSVSAAKVLGLEVASFRTKAEAKSAREAARSKLKARAADPASLTVRGWWEVWTTNPHFQRPKEASNINNKEMTKKFVDAHGHVLLRDVDRRLAGSWLLGDGKQSQTKFLRVMFSDALKQDLIDRNPFSRAGTARGHGNARKDPPTLSEAWGLIDEAWSSCPPGFAAWLQVACFTGLRTCELDALTWDKIRDGWIHVDREYCSKSHGFAEPKNNYRRRAILTPPALEALEKVQDGRSEFCFVSARGHHWRRNSRAYYWDRVRRATSWTGTLYVSTRHFFGSYAVNELGLPFEDVAAALGHTDRGELVRKLYGHFDDERALERVRAAYEGVDWRRAA